MEINPLAIAHCLQELVKKEFPQYGVSEPSELEWNFARDLFSQLCASLTDAVVQDDEFWEGKVIFIITALPN